MPVGVVANIGAFLHAADKFHAMNSAPGVQS